MPALLMKSAFACAQGNGLTKTAGPLDHVRISLPALAQTRPALCRELEIRNYASRSSATTFHLARSSRSVGCEASLPAVLG